MAKKSRRQRAQQGGGNKAAQPGTAADASEKPAEKPAHKTADAQADVRTTATSIGDGQSAGKQRRAALRLEREALASSAIAPDGPAEKPAFFFGFEMSWAKIVLARVLFFGLLAYDSLEQISHAPRYGAGDFNVAHFALLDPIAPGRVLYSTGQLLIAYLLVLAACGVATRVVVPIATALFGWLYFGSQLDSYQHHYLVWLLLLLSCFVPWQRPVGATPATRVRSWALRLILVQLAILYFWAAVSKTGSAWLDGRTLDMQLSGSIEAFIHKTVGYKGAAWLVLLTELALAATIWHRRGWLVAAPLGLALHIGILETGFEIGLFAYLMLALYVLVIPDRIWIWVADLLPIRRLRGAASGVAQLSHGSARFVIWILAAGGGLVLAMMSRFDHGPTVGLWIVLALLAGTVLAVKRRTPIAWPAAAHLLAFTLWTVVDRATPVTSDYYRLWGGSSRRLGNPKAAETAYRSMTEVDPNNAQGFFQLGRLLLAREAGDEGLAALRRAQDLEPLKARAYVAEARWLSTHGKREEAIAKAREATIVDPNDQEARTLLNTLLGTK